MAFAAGFQQENDVLAAPVGVSSEDVQALSICRTSLPDDTPVVISCWKLTQEELDEINRTGRVWLVLWGRSMPPAYVAGCNPFE